MIAISSAHRKDSLEAVDFAINELKRTVPIWKKVIIVIENCHTSFRLYGIVFRRCTVVTTPRGSETRRHAAQKNMRYYMRQIVVTCR